LIVRYGESRFDELDKRGFKMVFGRADEGSSPPLPRTALIRLGWRKFSGDDRIWMIEDSVWESEFCRGFDPVQVSRALARHGMLKCAKDRFTYAERFEDKRNKRFHVITAKILTPTTTGRPKTFRTMTTATSAKDGSEQMREADFSSGPGPSGPSGPWSRRLWGARLRACGGTVCRP
jgi:hypothetical protein